MRVLVCGGRDFDDSYLFWEYMDNLRAEGMDHIISGGARGADHLAEMYADREEINIDVYPADWEKFGKSAGYIRNKQMLIEGRPDLVIAFPGGKGTAMMVKLAKEAGVPVKEVMGP